jgi:hypothetical protein
MAAKKKCELDQQASNFGTVALGATVIGGLAALVVRAKRRRYAPRANKK